MRLLIPPGPADLETEEARFHAYRTPRRDWVRANFIASIDGSAAIDGRAGGLGSPVDQQILAILRAHAEVVLVGAATVREEKYGPLRHTPTREALRRELGFTDPARLAVVTAHPTFTGDERWIAEAPIPPLILTTDSAARDVPGAEVIACGEGEAGWIEPRRIITALTDRGLRAILCEGGPHVMGELTGAALVDELCLTLSPVLAGPGTPRIVAGPPWSQRRVSRLTQLLEADGLLFARYAFEGVLDEPVGEQA